MTLTTTRPVPDFAGARRAMIESQLRTSGVNDAFVLERMGAVPREDFVPPAARGVAYTDRAVPLDDGNWLAAPLVHGRMLAEARPTLADRALVVDGGSGYLPALLRPLVAEMQAIGVDEALASSRRKGGFTLLLIDGAIETFPATLGKRLNDDARVVAGLVRNGVTRLAVGCKAGGEVGFQILAEMGIPRLPRFDVDKSWTF